MVWDFRTKLHTIPSYHTRFYSMPISSPSDNITMLNEAIVLCVNLKITFAGLDRGVFSSFSHPFLISPTLFSFHPPFLSLLQSLSRFFHPLTPFSHTSSFFSPTPHTPLFLSPIPCIPAPFSPFWLRKKEILNASFLWCYMYFTISITFVETVYWITTRVNNIP